MKEKIIVKKIDESEVKVFTSVGVDQELNDFFAFYVPNYRFMKEYKMKLWDGKKRLYNRITKKIYYGLCPYLKKFAEDRDYEIEFDEEIQKNEKKVTQEQFEQFIQSLKLPFEPRDYQIRTGLTAIQRSRAVLVSPTASGKSLSIYTILRWYLNQKNDSKILLIVPTTSLVEQMASDFASYSQNDDSFDANNNIHKIYEGKSKDSDASIIVSTWQSLYQLPAKFFHQFDVVFVDEAHQATANSITKIVSNCKNAKYRFGATGTLHSEKDSKVHKLVLQGLFGIIFEAVTTSELMDRKILANLNIKALIVNYPEDDRKLLKKCTYDHEIKYLISHEKRNNLIVKLACKSTKNTLVTFRYVKHGKYLYNQILKQVGPERKVFFIDGKTKTEIREQTRSLTEESENAIIVASVGVFSVGINIKNLDNIIFSTPSKSKFRVLQSIGRILRIGNNDQATLIDIADNLCYKKSHKNYSFKHFTERLKIYTEQKFNYILHHINF